MSDLLRKRAKDKSARHQRAHQRLRKRVRGTGERPRLAVHKSLKYIYAQVINDRTGETLAHASSLEAAVRAGVEGSSAGAAAAKAVGARVAERAIEKGIKSVVFDRGGYVYHGSVKALADAAREKGLEF